MMRTSCEAGRWVVLAGVVADMFDRDRLALVGRREDRAAVERLEAFGPVEAYVEAARDIQRDVIAADRDAIHVDQRAARKDRDRGRA
ncbi:MAG: hypothetical protein U1E19_11245 [Rhodoblastus sp.]